MEAQRWFGHEHPLAFNEVPVSNQSEQTHCFRCDEVMWGPSFSCTTEGCGFYLHKRCAEAPSQIDHPFHSKHPLLLLPEPRYNGGCDFCGGRLKKYVYNCSCNIDLHIKCALYTYNFAKKSFGELYHIPHIDPLISSGQDNNEEQLESADCGINLRKICLQLPYEIACHNHHQHPLYLQFAGQFYSCKVCHEAIKGFVYYCTACDWALHINCRSVPSQINHPFHSKHPLVLLPNPSNSPGRYSCNFCGKAVKKVVYHCSCNVNLHILCALFTYDFSKQSLGDLQHVPHIEPVTSTQYKKVKKLESADCGINLQKICAELPFEMDCLSHRKHRKHPLTLQFGGEWFSCKVCLKSQLEGFVYCCSPCNFGLHFDCVSLPASLKDKCHDQHPFTLCLKQVSFICNICGKEGDSIPYICCTCGFMVHKNCISLPQAIKMTLHHHIITRTYFLPQEESKKLDCQVCFDEVNTEYGSYYCSKCDFIVHVNCALELEGWYYEVDLENKDKLDRLALSYDMSMESIIEVFERNEAGEATIIRHFDHAHDLVLSDKVMDDVKCCDGCMLLITSPFFHCLQCDFLLHKSCAELPRKKIIWYEKCQHPFILTSLAIFRCKRCHCASSGFAYECSECKRYICLRCAIPFALKHEGHEHPLDYVHKYTDGKCNACGWNIDDGYVFKCKSCDFALCFSCLTRPQRVRDKCDKHVMKLTYHDDNDCLETHFCDICEKERDSKYWFYRCEICDTSVHIVCVHNDYQFIKVGVTFEEKIHRHPLTFVRKVYYYPACTICNRPCQGMALECLESGCNYINCTLEFCLQPWYWFRRGPLAFV